ncbi:MAG: acetoacetate--CoA ligase [Actinomycetia bacterium]|nr:acetoacetate--CoA ligase [Actinomycetes bacterium]
MPEQPLWDPTAESVAATRLDRFRRSAEVVAGRPLHGYPALHRWSVEDPGAFWDLVWTDLGVIGDRGSGPAMVPGAELLDTRFFPEARLNYAQNLLRIGDPSPAGADPVMLSTVEGSPVQALSRADLLSLVGRLSQFLRAEGVGPGDRVAAWMPNAPETYAVMLAAAAIGAVFTSTSPDFGSDGVVDRFGQTEPVVLFATDGYRYNGSRHDVLSRLADVRAALPSVRRVVVLPFPAADADADAEGDRGSRLAGIDDAITWSEALDRAPSEELRFEQLAFDHPLFILYSSGTTGKPKCIVHRAGGVLLKHLTEHQLHADIRPGDRVLYFTTAGWMMWNWLATALASGASLVLYDGSPTHPTVDVLFDLTDEVGVTLFGTSAKFIDSLNKLGRSPRTTHALDTVRTLTSTGSPLVPESFDYVYDQIGDQVFLTSMSGGTDLCGCLVIGDPTSPVWRGEIQRAALGLDIAVVDGAGQPITEGQGELVCRTPFPSMPLEFWNDPGDERYRAAYFDRFPGIWHQGDFAEWCEHGGLAIHGRSDATLNPGGVRIGTAEIYRQVEQLDEVTEGLVISQDHEADQRVVLFVTLREGLTLDDELSDRIRRQIRTGASPRHVPAVVVQVPELPRTRSGKLVELAVRDVVHGRPVLNQEALVDPSVLDYFRARPELA